MTDFNRFHFGFIGLGLIGGSIAKAIRLYWPGARITAYNPSEDALRQAQDEGVVNDGHCKEEVKNGHPFNGEAFSDCDIVFLCAPVQKNAENLAEIAPYLKNGAVLTDIGSTKSDIHRHVREAGLSKFFIGGHPMTGSERTRYRNSSATLLENAYYLLTPEPAAGQDKTALLCSFVEGIRSLPLLLEPSFHDFAVAGISHVPHVVSASLVELVRRSDNPDAVMHAIAAGGFKDITRISSSSAEMWREICLTNSGNIVKLLDSYIGILKQIKDSIASGSSEDIYNFFDSARRYRGSFAETGSGARDRSFVIHVDIEDHPASLAEVVTLLAVNSVNIKNIGITHNREYQQGVLRVEFYSESDQAEAADILRTRNYTIYL